jgi:PAS domain-containing protein
MPAIPPEEKLLKQVLDAIPSFVFIVDKDVRVLDTNKAADAFFGAHPEARLQPLCGDYLCCVNAPPTNKNCGHSQHCPDCSVRNAINATVSGQPTLRKLHRMRLRMRGEEGDLWLLITANPLQAGQHDRFLLILEDVSELVSLRSLVPMCASCRKVRDDKNYWQSVEHYLIQHTSMKFSHGLCPDCLKLLYPDLADASKQS